MQAVVRAMMAQAVVRVVARRMHSGCNRCGGSGGEGSDEGGDGKGGGGVGSGEGNVGEIDGEGGSGRALDGLTEEIPATRALRTRFLMEDERLMQKHETGLARRIDAKTYAR